MRLRLISAREGEDLEGAALEHLPKGRIPLESRLLGVGTGAYARPLPRWYFLPRLCFPQGRSPAYHFFVKKKFSPTGGAETTTQKVPSVFYYARDFLQGGAWCYARNTRGFLRRTELVQKSRCGAGTTPHAGRSFFLYEKSVLRESDSLRSRSQEICTDSPLFFRP